jgi:hypothetical protein
MGRALEMIQPDAFRSPGYPLFLSLFIPQAPSHLTITTILLWQAVLSTLTVILGWRLYQGYLSACWAGAAAVLTAMSPHLVAMNIYVLSETLFCLFLVVAAGLMAGLAKRPTMIFAIALGGCLGAANLIRPSLQFFPLILAGFILWGFRPPRGKKLAALVVAGFILVLVPWHVRNLVSTGRWSDPKLQIDFLHHGMYPDFMFDGKSESYGIPYRFDPRSPEIVQSNAAVLQEIVQRLQREPAGHLSWYLLKKPIAYWSWNIVQGQGDIFVYPVLKTPYWENELFKQSHRLMQLLHQPLVLLGCLGLILVWHPAAAKRLDSLGLAISRFFSLLLIYFTALHMVGAPFPRYSIPLRPFLYGMSILPVAWSWQWLSQRMAKGNRLFTSANQNQETMK